MTKKIEPAPPQNKSQFDVSFQQGTTLLHEGKHLQALPLLEQAHELEPDHADVALNLSGAYILAKKFKKAVPILEKLGQQYPQNSMIWTNLGAAYLGNPILARDEEQVQAIAAFEHALQINPVAPNVAYNIGLIYRDRRENEKAISWFRRAIQSNPHDQDARKLVKKLETQSN
ncbi:MAG: tetratricopeptide repeat protein [Chloroflexi bacterium]|nr:tetratricopeptide repeat protein [Chloroflexota bacterium]